VSIVGAFGPDLVAEGSEVVEEVETSHAR
jgi:hypothetical protein